MLGFSETGLEIIESLGIQNAAILVTSRYEELEIRSKCIALGVPLLPKGMVGFVQLKQLKATEDLDAILIDDDELVHLTWTNSAIADEKRVRVFGSPADFYQVESEISRKTPIYIDSNLGNGIKGEDLAKELHERGFRTLYLATGGSTEKFAGLTFLKGTRGKSPPWIS